MKKLFNHKLMENNITSNDLGKVITYLKKYKKKYNINKDFKNVDHVHFFGYYIGNYPGLKKSKIKKICEIINSI